MSRKSASAVSTMRARTSSSLGLSVATELISIAYYDSPSSMTRAKLLSTVDVPISLFRGDGERALGARHHPNPLDLRLRFRRGPVELAAEPERVQGRQKQEGEEGCGEQPAHAGEGHR